MQCQKTFFHPQHHFTHPLKQDGSLVLPCILEAYHSCHHVDIILVSHQLVISIFLMIASSSLTMMRKIELIRYPLKLMATKYSDYQQSLRLIDIFCIFFLEMLILEGPVKDSRLSYLGERFFWFNLVR